MWALKLNEAPQGYFGSIDEAKLHATKMFGLVSFDMKHASYYTATVASRGNVTVTIEFEED